MVTASASSAGTATDPLISLSYLNGAFSTELKDDVSQALESTADNALDKLDGLYSTYASYSFAARFTRISLSTGDSVMLTMGSSFVLLSGSATLASSDGTVINISSGAAVAPDTRLSRNNRYFCAEDGTALITASSSAIGQVDGYYHIVPAVPVIPHPVFRDVTDKDWFYAAVDFVYTNNLFGGTSSNTFSPSASMTRGMFVTVLYRLEGSPSVGAGGQFTDVRNTSQYYYDAVTWANANNIVRGYSNGSFRPNDAVTREQTATIMHRYAEYKNRDLSASNTALNPFSDSGNVSGYALDAMRWAVSKGLISGSGGRLLPRSTATRAQVAQMISDYVSKVG